MHRVLSLSHRGRPRRCCCFRLGGSQQIMRRFISSSTLLVLGISSLFIVVGCGNERPEPPTLPVGTGEVPKPAISPSLPTPSPNTTPPTPPISNQSNGHSELFPVCHPSYLSIDDRADNAREWTFSPAATESSVLLISIYQSKQGPGWTLDENNNPIPPVEVEGTATVKDERTTPHTLVLSAYQATAWTIEATRPDAIQKIYAIGQKTPRVQAPAGIPVATFEGIYGDVHYSRDLERDPNLAPIRKVVGGRIDEIVSAYESKSMSVKNTPTSRCVEPLAVVPVGTKMKWEAWYGLDEASVVDDVFTAPAGDYHSAAFFGSTLRDKGKFYFEAEVATALPDTRWTALGVSNAMPYSSEGRGCTFEKDGGAFCGWSPSWFESAPSFAHSGARVGLAVNLDDGEMFMHVDGAWTPHAPGEGTGFPIAREALAPVVEVAPGDKLALIFDPSKMKKPVPTGYTAGW